MTPEEVLRDVSAIIEKHFKCVAGSVDENTTASSVEGWDSLAHTSLILKLEKAFGIRFDVSEAFGFRTVGEMADRIARLLAPQHAGSVDELSLTAISGWAWDPQRPQEPVIVNIFDDERLVLSIKADRFRQDLKDAGIGTGHHAFLVPHVRALFPGSRHRVSVRRAQDGADLHGAPQVLVSRGGTLDAAGREFVEGLARHSEAGVASPQVRETLGRLLAAWSTFLGGRAALRRELEGLDLNEGTQRTLDELLQESPAAAAGEAQNAQISSAKAALVVLGMHRSGTSVLAAAFATVGWRLPSDLMPPLADNPEGFNESIAIATLNEAILHEAGSEWCLPAFIGASRSAGVPGPFLERHLDKARAILRGSFQGARAICLKCPRLLLLSSLWDTALRLEGFSPRYVFALRHPNDVAESLKARTAIGRMEGLRLWMRYALALAELPTDARVESVIEYENLMADPEACIDPSYDIAVLPNRVGSLRAVINPALRHHGRGDREELPAPVEALYKVLQSQALRTAPDRTQALARHREQFLRAMDSHPS